MTALTLKNDLKTLVRDYGNNTQAIEYAMQYMDWQRQRRAPQSSTQNHAPNTQSEPTYRSRSYYSPYYSPWSFGNNYSLFGYNPTTININSNNTTHNQNSKKKEDEKEGTQILAKLFLIAAIVLFGYSLYTVFKAFKNLWQQPLPTFDKILKLTFGSALIAIGIFAGWHIGAWVAAGASAVMVSAAGFIGASIVAFFSTWAVGHFLTHSALIRPNRMLSGRIQALANENAGLDNVLNAWEALKAEQPAIAWWRNFIPSFTTENILYSIGTGLLIGSVITLFLSLPIALILAGLGGLFLSAGWVYQALTLSGVYNIDTRDTIPMAEYAQPGPNDGPVPSAVFADNMAPIAPARGVHPNTQPGFNAEAPPSPL